MCRKSAENMQVLKKICSYCRKCVCIAENLQALQIMCRKSAENMQLLHKICRKSAAIAENLHNRIPASKRSTSESTEDNTVKTTGNGSTNIGEVITPRIRNRSTKDFVTKGKEKLGLATKRLRNRKRVPQ